MSVEALAVVLHHSRAKGTARLVLLGIANHDGDGGSWPSIATLGKYAGGVDRSTVQRALARLVELGEVEVDRQQGGTQETPDELRPNRYWLTLSCPGDCDRSTQHRTARKLRLDRAAPTRPGSASAAGRGRASAAPGAAPTRPEPSTNHPGNTRGAVPAQPQKGTTPVDNAPEHLCQRGWLLDHDGDPTPCLVCKPHLAGKRRP